MRTVITYGTFDTLHHGHIRLLTRASQLGDRLIVALSSDTFNETKGKKSLFSFSERKKYLESLKCVDLVIKENSWDQKIDDVIKYSVRTFVIGDDWSGKFDFLMPFCDVVYLERTPHISSTEIRSLINAV